MWDAKIALLLGVSVRVVDSYIQGKGLLRAKVQGLFTMAGQRGDGAIARGEFMRWFAEAAEEPARQKPSPALALEWGRGKAQRAARAARPGKR